MAKHITASELNYSHIGKVFEAEVGNTVVVGILTGYTKNYDEIKYRYTVYIGQEALECKANGVLLYLGEV